MVLNVLHRVVPVGLWRAQLQNHSVSQSLPSPKTFYKKEIFIMIEL